MSPILRTVLLVITLAALAVMVNRSHTDPIGIPDALSPIASAELIVEGAPPRIVALPHDWREDPNFNRAIYRFTIESEVDPDVAWSLYLPRSSPPRVIRISNLDVPIYQHASTISADLSYRLVPWLVPIPLDVLKTRSITIDVELEVRTGFGYMGPVWVGPASIIDAAHAQRWLWMVSIWRVVAIGIFAFSVVLGATWFLRRSDGVALWLGILMFFVSLSMWNIVTFDLPVWRPPTTYIGNGIMLAIIVLLVHRLHDVENRRVELGFFLFGVFAFATRLFVPPGPMQVALRLPLFSVMVVAAMYPLAIVVREQLRGIRPEQDFVTAAIFVLVPAASHDVLVQGGILPRSHDPVALFAIGISASLFGWIFVRRFIGALETSERLTDTLEERVAEKENELAANYERLAELERERVIEQERSRMVEELHDGTGGQIVSALALLNDPQTPRVEVAEGLRRALEDMRLVLYSLDHRSADLGTLLGLLRDQLERPIHAAGLRLVWDVGDVENPSGYGPEVALDIARIIQTAVANAIEHGHANEIALRTRVEDDGRIVITIEDDGVGLSHPEDGESEGSASSRGGRGRGFVHIHRRAERIGAMLKIVPRSPGTAVELVLAAHPRLGN